MKASPSVASLPLYLVVNAIASMQAIVSKAQRIFLSVSPNCRTNASGGIRSQTADSTAAIKMPVPVVDSQLKS